MLTAQLLWNVHDVHYVRSSVMFCARNVSNLLVQDLNMKITASGRLGLVRIGLFFFNVVLCGDTPARGVVWHQLHLHIDVYRGFDVNQCDAGRHSHFRPSVLTR